MANQQLAQRVIEDLRVEVFRSGLSQQRIAEMIGASAAWVQRRLSGEVDATIPELSQIATAAGLDLDVILSRREAAQAVAS